jgi:hypothetical protein
MAATIRFYPEYFHTTAHTIFLSSDYFRGILIIADTTCNSRLAISAATPNKKNALLTFSECSG